MQDCSVCNNAIEMPSASASLKLKFHVHESLFVDDDGPSYDYSSSTWAHSLHRVTTCRWQMIIMVVFKVQVYAGDETTITVYC